TATSDGKLGNVTMETGTTLNAIGANRNIALSGTLTLNGNATVTLEASGNDVPGLLAVAGGIAIANGATIKGSLYGNGTVVSVGSGKTISGTGTLTLTNNTERTNSWAISAPIAGDLKVVKAGAVGVTLTGAGTYSGGTELTGGTLTAKASSIGPGNVTVASGATLAISDSSATNKLAIHASKTLAGAGTITGNVSFADTAILNASTVLTVNGTLTLPTVGTVAVTLPELQPQRLISSNATVRLLPMR
ncbi:MAG: hypothetical protein RR982_07080, partial [Kiritimatiellia bacterium]